MGAFRCLQEKGDIAFINEKTIFQVRNYLDLWRFLSNYNESVHAMSLAYFQGGEFNPNDFELLCPIGDEPSADPSLDAFASNYNDATDFSR